MNKIEDIGQQSALLEKILQYYTTRQRAKLETYVAEISQKYDRCVARIHDDTQCTRKSKDKTTHLCGNHCNSTPYGRIDDIPQQPEKKYKVKKSKVHNQDIGSIDLKKYIKTTLININDSDYLIDENGIIYENNDANTIVGHKITEDQIDWF
jgi:hypothetical protein